MFDISLAAVIRSWRKLPFTEDPHGEFIVPETGSGLAVCSDLDRRSGPEWARLW